MTDVYAAQPEPPVNVRISYLDGHEEPVELYYDGTDGDGIHRWVATPMQPLLSRYAHIKADQIPPRTSITLRVSP